MVLAALSLVAGGLNVAAATSLPVPTAPPRPGPGYFATDNVEWVATIPLNADSAGARLLNKRLYVTDDRGLTIYDVSTPELPRPLGFQPLPQTPYIPEEDVDTNGKRVLVGTLGRLFVVDVRDPSRPALEHVIQGADAHTVSCVLDCRYAWLNTGPIYDLDHPEGPTQVGDWTAGAPADGSHDVTEVAPGVVLTSSNPMVLLDARKNPAKPRRLATGSPRDKRFMHGNLWPRKGQDRWVLAGGETSGSCNDRTAGAFMVFDSRGWQKSGTLRMVDEHRLTTGLPSDGKSLYDQYCAHWFDTHPSWRDGGRLAMAWYEHGTRFLDVSRTSGAISEIGLFLPLAGSTSAAYWLNDRIVYAIDYQRGIDILRFSGKPATRIVAHGGARGTSLDRLPAPGPTRIWGRADLTCPIPA
jgi:hypothetical protein